MKTHTDTKPVADVLRDAAVIVTYTDEQGRHDEVRTAALDAARRAGAQLILYPLELYSPLSNPLPTEWSAEGDRASYARPSQWKAASASPSRTYAAAMTSGRT